MPALITHHLFGEEAAHALPEGLLEGEEELLAFLLGNLGPDPLFARFATLPDRAARCRSLAHLMHGPKAMGSLLAMRETVAHLHRDDMRVGRAFALGQLAHYLLDSRCHAFVYAQQHALAHADTSLKNAQSELHALIESDLDVWMLWSMRQAEVDPSIISSSLARTERVSRVGGAIFSQVAMQVFGVSVDARQYEGGLVDFEFLYHAIEPADGPRNRLIGSVERIVRPHSLAMAQAHLNRSGDSCPDANLDHQPWRDPSTGEVRTESFPDLFWNAFGEWDGISRAYVSGERDRLAPFVTRDYDGIPLEGRS
jgi:hypothetical protein